MRAIAVAALGSIACSAALGMVVLWIAGRAATDRAITQARQLGELDAHVVLGPYVSDALLDGDRAAYDALDRVTRTYVDTSGATRVKIWSLDERIVYSDEPRLVGQRFQLPPEDLAVAQQPATGSRSALSDAERPENQYERGSGRLLEVFVGARTASGRAVLIETYFPFHLVADTAHQIRSRFVPAILGSLGLLALVQIPLAVVVTRRSQHAQQHRHHLMKRVLSISDAERRRVAAEVHDGAVQDLIGLTFMLRGMAEEAPEPMAGRLDHVATELNTTVRNLRGLLSSIYPVPPSTGRLDDAIGDLTDDLRSSGVVVTVDAPDQRTSGTAAQMVVVRAARELLRNAERHAGASHIDVTLRERGDRLVLDVIDDGVGIGMGPTDAGQPRHDQLGLRLLRDLAADAGGELSITAASHGGTVAHLEVPVAR